MTREQIQARLSSIRKFDFGAAEALARDILKDARVPLHTLHRLAAVQGNPDGDRAQDVLRSLSELSILPWLVVGRRLPAGRQAQPVHEAYRAYQAFEQRLRQSLRAMLSRRNLVPPPNLGDSEVKPKPTRECDEAYLLLQRLARPDEPPEEHGRRRSAFLARSEADRDGMILELLQND